MTDILCSEAQVPALTVEFCDDKIERAGWISTAQNICMTGMACYTVGDCVVWGE